jgi:hypothetical protein
MLVSLYNQARCHLFSCLDILVYAGRGGQIIRLPPTDRIPNRNRTDINRLPTLPTKFGSVVGRDFLTESRFGSVGGSVALLTDLPNRTEPKINRPF